MEEFEKKVSLRDPMEEEKEEERDKAGKCSSKTVDLLREFLGIQQRRAEAYAKLKRGFGEYMESCSGAHGELAYQQVCSEVTVEFNECSKHVLRIESLFLNDPNYGRVDLAHLLRAVQTQEKQKLNLVFNSSYIYFPFLCNLVGLFNLVMNGSWNGGPNSRILCQDFCF